MASGILAKQLAYSSNVQGWSWDLQMIHKKGSTPQAEDIPPNLSEIEPSLLRELSVAISTVAPASGGVAHGDLSSNQGHTVAGTHVPGGLY